jgi:hypothetical protein
MTSANRGIGTDVVGIVLDVIDGVLDEVDSLGVSFVRFPVTCNHSLVSGE